jgi:hypothetical protein
MEMSSDMGKAPMCPGYESTKVSTHICKGNKINVPDAIEDIPDRIMDAEYSFQSVFSKDWFTSSSPDVRVAHFGQVARREYGQGDFEELDAYPRNWLPDGIDQVLESGRNAKFMIPTKSPHHGKT